MGPMPRNKWNADDDDRAAEYVDSSLMTQRLVHAHSLSARVHGHYGTYRTTVSLRRAAEYSCTCPSDFTPCKHVRALRATWDTSPSSFFVLAPFLDALRAKSKRELIQALELIFVEYPTTLAAFGIPGFEMEDDDIPE